MSALLIATGASGPLGVFGPGGPADLGRKDKPAPPAGTVAAPVAPIPEGVIPGIPNLWLVAGGVGLVALMALR